MITYLWFLSSTDVEVLEGNEDELELERLSQGVQPDVLIEYDKNSFFSGRDNLMERIIKDICST